MSDGNFDLFDDVSKTSACKKWGQSRQKTRAPATGKALLAVEPHVCRICGGGRIVSRGRVYECTNCGATHEGADASGICFCGAKVSRLGKEVDLGLRCHKNPSPTPEFPSLYVASSSPPN